MTYPELVHEFIRDIMTKHAATLREAANDPGTKALLDLGYRYQTEVIIPELIDEAGVTIRLEAKLVPPVEGPGGMRIPIDKYESMPEHTPECALVTTHHLTCTCGAYNQKREQREQAQVWVLAYRPERDEYDYYVEEWAVTE